LYRLVRKRTGGQNDSVCDERASASSKIYKIRKFSFIAVFSSNNSCSWASWLGASIHFDDVLVMQVRDAEMHIPLGG
jgi:hypothetical protein